MVVHIPVTVGADPELFLKDTTTGKIIGSERVIPREGLKEVQDTLYKPLVVRDGVQVELHPYSKHCRQQFGGSIGASIRVLIKHLRNNYPHIEPSLDMMVEVDEKELSSLSPDSLLLGCMPSKNIHNPHTTTEVAPGYAWRSAAGHIHLGLQVGMQNIAVSTLNLISRREEMVPLMDIFVGNTCVLLDRDPLAAERRKTYGRAGEYRLPDYGLEYRTPSNFWLKRYVYGSFVTGLARMAASVIGTDQLRGHERVFDQSMAEVVVAAQYPPGESYNSDAVNLYYRDIPKDQDLLKQLYSLIQLPKVVEAINTNDYGLALKNYYALKPFIQEHFHKSDHDFGWPLHEANVELFEFFLANNPESFFAGESDNLLTRWDTHMGWENFLRDVVRFVMLRERYFQEAA